jgi:cytochrome c
MAADRAPPDEARTMAVKAAEYLKANGPEQAFAAFDAKDGPRRDRDLYVSVIDTNGVMRAHGTNPGLIGRSVIDLRSASISLVSAPTSNDRRSIKPPGTGGTASGSPTGS